MQNESLISFGLKELFKTMSYVVKKCHLVYTLIFCSKVPSKWRKCRFRDLFLPFWINPRKTSRKGQVRGDICRYFFQHLIEKVMLLNKTFLPFLFTHIFAAKFRPLLGGICERNLSINFRFLYSAGHWRIHKKQLIKTTQDKTLKYM